MNKVIRDTLIKDVKNELNKVIDDLVTETNVYNLELFNTVKNITIETDNIIKKTSVLSDMLLDLKSITNSTNSLDLKNLKDRVIESKNIEIVNNSISLTKSNINSVEFNSKQSVIRSMFEYSIQDSLNNSEKLENVLKYNKPFNITFINRQNFNLDLILTFNNVSKVNELTFDFLNQNNLPTINSISYLDLNNNIIPILFNINLESIDLNNKLTIENKYSLIFETIQTKQLIINISNVRSNILELEKISTYYNTYPSDGYIIFNYTNEKPILKVSVSSDTNNSFATLEVSTDLQNWIKLDRVESISLDNVKKILSFNTTNTKSFKTEEEVKSIYFKVTFTNPTKNLEDNFSFIKENTLSNFENINSNKYTNYLIKNTDNSYGKDKFILNSLVSNLELSDLETIRVNNRTKFLGFLNNEVSINYNSNYNSDILFTNRLKKVSTNIIDSTTLDPIDYTIYDINIVKDSNITKSSENICFKLKYSEGLYFINHNKNELVVNLTTNFTLNSNSLTIILENNLEDVIIYNEIKEKVVVIKKEDIKSFTFNNTSYFYISLLTYLYNNNTIDGLTLNVLYPLVNISEKEYSVVNGKLVLNTSETISGEMYKILKKKATYETKLSYINGNYLERISPENLTKNTQDVFESKDTLKLNHTFIKKGSIKIVSINNPNELTYTPNTTETINYLNVNTKEDPKYLKLDTTDETIYLEI